MTTCMIMALTLQLMHDACNGYRKMVRKGNVKIQNSKVSHYIYVIYQLECGPMPNVMAALPNIGGALCSAPQSLADAQYWSAVQ